MSVTISQQVEGEVLVWISLVVDLVMAWKGKQIVSIASRVYFVLILFQIPLFRIQCRSGMCTTPVEMTASQLIASDIFPPVVVKALLYPGAIAKGLILERKIPGWNNILGIYNLTDVKNASSVVELQRLEVLAGSYFSVAGALIGVIKSGRMSLFGTLLIVWGLVKEGILGKSGNITEPEKTLYVYPTILVALVCAFASIKYDIQKAIRGGQARPIAKPLQSSSKSKLK